MFLIARFCSVWLLVYIPFFAVRQAVRKWKLFLFWFDVQAFLQKPQFITIVSSYY